MKPKYIDTLSLYSILLHLKCKGKCISKATGIILERETGDYLVTCWHVFSGINPDSGYYLSPYSAVPDEVLIYHHDRRILGKWVAVSQSLIDASGNKLWFQHPEGKKYDLAALRIIRSNPNIVIHHFDWRMEWADLQPAPAMPVSIIGYPFGKGIEGIFPIWITGHIATDPDLDYGGKPMLLVNASAREGMSGAPVVIRLHGGYKQSDGTMVLGGERTKFIGIYAGRSISEMDICRVWKPIVIKKLLEGK